jgi:hypothetical protein
LLSFLCCSPVSGSRLNGTVDASTSSSSYPGFAVKICISMPKIFSVTNGTDQLKISMKSGSR